MFLKYYLIFLAIIVSSDAARILVVTPSPSLAHQNLLHPIILELSKNHELVSITSNPVFTKDTTPKNLTEIDIHELSYKAWNKYSTPLETGKDNFIYTGVKQIVEVTSKVLEDQMKSDAVQDVIKSEKPFDLILVQGAVRPAMIWSHIFKVPVIKVNCYGLVFDNAENLGAPFHPLLYPDVFHQKIYNLSYSEMFYELYKRYYVEKVFDSNLEAENEMLRRNFGSDVPAISELNKNVHMMFLNVNPLWERNRPLPLNVVYIGHIQQKPVKPLPQDIKTFLDESTQGAIYMSLGTNVVPSRLPKKIQKIYLKVIAGLPYRVLLKWDVDKMEGKPDNLMTSNWFPQSDVLRHPNLKLVITQGGLQTTEEAINCGLPLVGIPMFADQWLNVEHYVHYGIGVYLDIDDLTEDKFRNAVLGVIENESYRNNVLRLRSIIHDQPRTPLQRAIHWIEYILKHGSTLHLMPAAANMSRSDYIEIELLVALLIFILCIVLLFVYVLKLIVRRMKCMLRNVFR